MWETPCPVRHSATRLSLIPPFAHVHNQAAQAAWRLELFLKKSCFQTVDTVHTLCRSSVKLNCLLRKERSQLRDTTRCYEMFTVPLWRLSVSLQLFEPSSLSLVETFQVWIEPLDSHWSRWNILEQMIPVNTWFKARTNTGSSEAVAF